MRRAHSTGFTFVEILIVIAIIALLASMAAVTFQNMNRTSALRVASQEVYTALADSRNSTLASKGDTVYGVHIDETEVVRFVGGSYSAGDPNNVTYEFVGRVTATSSLTSGAVDIVFGRLDGQPSATGTIVLTRSDKSASTTITIYDTGLVESE